MSDISLDFCTRVDQAMRKIGFEVTPNQPDVVNNAPPNVFCQEYAVGSFKYLVTITENDIGRHGADKMIAMNTDGAKAGLGWQSVQKFG
jgi:hypothetical protein